MIRPDGDGVIRYGIWGGLSEEERARERRRRGMQASCRVKVKEGGTHDAR